MSDDQLLNARYGRSPKVRPRTWWIVGIGAVLLSGIAIIGLVVAQPSANIEYSTPHYALDGTGGVVVTVDVTMSPGRTARCAVEALGEDQQAVGWTYVDVPASVDYSQSLVVSVRAISSPAAATVPQCWLTE